MLKKLKLSDSMKTYKTSSKKHQQRCLFHQRRLNAKVGSQEIPGVTGKFDLGVQNEARQRLTELCKENTLVIVNTHNNTRGDSTHGHHHMVSTEIRLIIFFAAEDGKALFSQQKQYLEVTVAQITSLSENSGQIEESRENH